MKSQKYYQKYMVNQKEERKKTINCRLRLKKSSGYSF